MRLLLVFVLVFATAAAPAAQRLHLLVPAGPGGGLDTTARALGNALQANGLRAPVSYENMTGGGGGRAMAHFVETAARQQDTLLINSTPLIVRSLQGLFPHSHHDVIPVAGLVGEWGVFAVRAESGIRRWQDFVGTLAANPSTLNVGGGSVRGSLDHIVLALALSAAGLDPRRVRYLPYDAGGRAMLALLGGEVDVLSTGLGEALGYAAAGEVHILAITAPDRVDVLPEVPTLTELDVPLTFTNWRGVFAAPGTPADAVDRLIADLRAATATTVWRDALERFGWTPLGLYGDDFRTYLDTQETQLEETLVELGFIRR